MDPYNSRPMSYDSLKILLQYAKPNLRFELSRRIPSIRLTEKAVPLKIDKLLIGSHGVEVDDIKYEARIKRYYSSDDTDLKQYDFNYTSENGDWDLDKWGFDDYSSETVFTPGDLVFQRERQMPRQAGRSEEHRKAIENELKFVEWMVAKKSGENVEPNWTGEDVPPYLINSSESASLLALKCNAERLKIALAPFNCFEKNVPLPFTKMVLVAIRSENGSLCWNYSGNLKYYEVRKQLMTWLLGNRKHVIKVDHLIVANGIIARLPENLRISVKMLQAPSFESYRIQVDTNTMLNKLEAIIQNNNRPLEVYDTYRMHEELDHPLATNAKKLVFSLSTREFPNANRLIRIPNQKLHVSCSDKKPGHFVPVDIVRLVSDWIENPREIGKCFSFEGIEKRVMKTMSRFQAVVDGAAFGVNTKRSVKIPLNNGSQISISYGRQVYRSWTRLRLMTIEVVAA
ncbi:unnamed protein product [Caenorhabditis brenneri]